MENQSLILDLVEWIAERPRPYEEVIHAWRTSCPRLSIWEDALDGGLVKVAFDDNATRTVSVTGAGERFLREHRAAR